MRPGKGRGLSHWSWGKAGLVAGLVVAAAAALCWVRGGKPPAATAAPADTVPVAAATAPAPSSSSPSDYSQRPVAYIYGTEAITREQLGEYLIQRLGTARLENLINRCIIEHACQQRGIEVTAAEIDAALGEDLEGLKVNLKDFVTKILKHYGKTLYEWKEDVIRPKLLMTKYCRDRVTVTEQDLHQAFEAHYGEQVKCLMILWPKGQEQFARRLYGDLRDKPGEFERQARQQPTAALAAKGGEAPPFGRHSTGSQKLEDAAFSLRPGEISSLLETDVGTVCLKCVQCIPPRTDKQFEQERVALAKEVYDKKIQAAMPDAFKEMRAQANPQKILAGDKTQEDIEREVENDLKATPLGRTVPPSPTQLQQMQAQPMPASQSK
jgi:parvulin-like peptidyl-prolyl isomerase